MKINAIMSKGPVTVNIDDPLSRVKDLFEENSFHHLLVVEKGVLLGVISDRDLLKALSPRIDTVSATSHDLACLNMKAHQIMTRKPISVNKNLAVKEAVKIFNQHNISCIPVVDKDQKPVGIVSWRDIMKVLVK